MAKIAIIGSGAWGTTLARLIALEQEYARLRLGALPPASRLPK